MTYIGIRREGGSRPAEPQGSRPQKKGEPSVDWKLIVDVSLLLSFFFCLSDKSDKEGREEGRAGNTNV